MEFSRRGPATDYTDAADRRFADPPPNGDPMLVMRDALLSQLHKDRLRQEIIVAELAKIERAMALSSAPGGHQASPIPTGECLTRCCQGSKAAQHNAASHEQRLLESNEAVPPSKTLPAEKWKFTGITIPVKKSKLPMKWNCTICQVQATSEQNLHQHYSGQKHLSNVATMELAKIERVMALSSAPGGHQASPMPTAECLTRCQGKAAQQNAASHEQRLLESNEDVPPSKTSPAEKWEFTGITIPVKKSKPPMKWNCTICHVQATSEQNLHQHYSGQKHLSNVATMELAKIERVMALSSAPGGHQASPMPTAECLTRCQGKAAQQNAASHEQKLLESNEAVPPSKTSPAEKWEFTGITIPVKKSKPPMKWNCTICHVQATSEQNLHQHYSGQKHLSNVATVDPATKASDQKAEMVAEPSLGTEQKKTSSIKWSCSTCQSTLEAHLKGKIHQQNIAAACAEGDKNGMPKNVVAWEAKSHSINVPKHSEKPPSAWSCSICQVICTCETDLKNHLRGIRHREKVQSLLEQSNSMARDSESRKSTLNSHWICSICHAHCTSESDLEKHLAGRRHQLNIQVVSEKTKQEEDNPSQMAKNQEPSSEWNCTMCEAKCNSKSQFEAHCRSSRHQQKIQAILGKGKIVKASSSRTANELPLDGSNGKIASSEMAEKQPALYFFEVCNLLYWSLLFGSICTAYYTF